MILLAILAASLAAAAADVDETQFRYTRSLDAAAGTPVRFEPDGSMYGHARVDFPDLRVLDAAANRCRGATSRRPLRSLVRPSSWWRADAWATR